MKVSWRNAGEEVGTFDHHHIFIPGEKRDGKNPHEFMVHLIRETAAVGLALNDKPIWKSTDYSSADELVMRALIGEPRQARVLINLDYNVQGDWIDEECRTCGHLYGTHSHDCRAQETIDTEWVNMLRSLDGR